MSRTHNASRLDSFFAFLPPPTRPATLSLFRHSAYCGNRYGLHNFPRASANVRKIVTLIQPACVMGVLVRGPWKTLVLVLQRLSRRNRTALYGNKNAPCTKSAHPRSCIYAYIYTHVCAHKYTYIWHAHFREAWSRFVRELQKAVKREGDGNRVNRSKAAGTIGIGRCKNIFFDRKEGIQRGRTLTPRIEGQGLKNAIVIFIFFIFSYA